MSFFPTDGGGIFKQGAFQIDPNTTPEMLARKREMLAAMMPQYGRAKYIGEGIGQLGTAIASNRQNSAMDKFEGEQRATAENEARRPYSASGGPLSILGMRPEPQSPDQRIADDTMTALGQPKQGGDRDAFIQQMMPHAQRVAQQTGLDPRIIIAQAAQETGWGKSAPGNNYFGIKSHGQAGGNTFATNEVVDGQTVRVNDSFRGYEGMGDSVDGYAQFLQDNPRYKDMLSAGDLDGQVAALGQSGYATDPNYANSVGSIARSIEVPQGSFAPGQGQQVAQNGGGNFVPQIAAIDEEISYHLEKSSNPYLAERTQISKMRQIKQLEAQKAALMGQQQMQQERQYRRDDMVFGRQLEQQDPMYQLNMQKAQRDLNTAADRKTIQGQDGRNYYIDTGEPVLPNVGPKPADPTTSQRDYQFYAQQEAASGREPLSFNQWDLQSRKAGANNISVSNGGGKFEEAFAKGDADMLGTVSEAGLSARRNIGRIDQLEGLLGQSATGMSGAAKLAAGEWGINTDGLSEIQAAQALINSLVPEQRQPGSGPMSDADLALFKQSLPRIINQPGGNQTIIQTMRGIAQYDAQGAAIVQQLRAGEIDRSTAFSMLQDRQNPISTFKAPQKAEPSIGGGVPDGIDPADWEFLSPQERALFQ